MARLCESPGGNGYGASCIAWVELRILQILVRKNGGRFHRFECGAAAVDEHKTLVKNRGSPAAYVLHAWVSQPSPSRSTSTQGHTAHKVKAIPPL